MSAPEEMQAFDLEAYDGVLAFGAALARIYRDRGWGARAFVWHEAADLRHFQPPGQEGEREGLIWIGNWGDGERSAERSEAAAQPLASWPAGQAATAAPSPTSHLRQYTAEGRGAGGHPLRRTASAERAATSYNDWCTDEAGGRTGGADVCAPFVTVIMPS